MKKIFPLLIVTLLISLISNLKVYSQITYPGAISPDSTVGNIGGTVIDSATNRPIKDAKIFIFDKSLRQGTSGNIIATNNGDYILPDFSSAEKGAQTDADGKFLINNVSAPVPCKYYCIIIKADGYNTFIINNAEVLPGALMSFVIDAKLVKNEYKAVFYMGNEKHAPFNYWDVLHANELTAKNKISNSGRQIADLQYQVFATREGLVGKTTANGHTIVSHDHFVALPSFRVLNKKDQTKFQVKVSYGSKSVTVPVWDVGPWNTHDDYWNPDSLREIYSNLHHGGKPGLGQGVPESMAAYYYKYNQGWSGSITNSSTDQYTVKLPAGIDLADGVFWDDLNLPDNTWIKVDYLWRPGISIGDTVEASSTVFVFDSPGGNLTTLESQNNKGVVVDGPQKASYAGYYYMWWKVKWNNNITGWAHEENYQRAGSNNVKVIIKTDPPGLNFKADGLTFKAPQTFNWILNQSHSISSSSQSNGTDTKYIWNYWNDYRQNPHNIYPSGDLTYTAYFKTQYKVSIAINPSDAGTVNPGNGTWVNGGTAVTFTSKANSGYQFKNWSGDVSSNDNPLSIILSKPLSLTANFSSTSAVDDETNSLPKHFALGQNYPNPFNPSTTINYSIPQSGFVSLKIFNVMGNEIATLVNEQEAAGNYRVEFNSKQLSSGIYFYKLTSGRNTLVRKMILMK